MLTSPSFLNIILHASSGKKKRLYAKVLEGASERQQVEKAQASASNC